MAEATLDEVTEKISAYNGGFNNLSESIMSLSGTMESDSATVALEQVSELIKSQGDMSVKQLKSSRLDMASMKQSILDSNRISEKDRGNLLTILSNQENIVESNTTIGKRASEMIQTTVKDNAVDIASVAAGVVGDSPAAMLGVKFLGDKFKEKREAKRQQVKEAADRADAIEAAGRKHDEELEVLRGSISNQDAIEKFNLTQDEVLTKAKVQGVSEQEYIDDLKNSLIEKSKVSKFERENIEAEESRISDMREAYGLGDIENVSPGAASGADTVEQTPQPLQQQTEVLKDATEFGLTDGSTPYLKEIRDLLQFMKNQQANADLSQIEKDREAARLAKQRLKVEKSSNDLLKKNNKITKTAGDQAADGEDSMIGDIMGSVLGAVGLGGAGLGGAAAAGGIKPKGKLGRIGSVLGGGKKMIGKVVGGVAAVAGGSFLADKAGKFFGGDKVPTPDADLPKATKSPVTVPTPDAPKVTGVPNVTPKPGAAVTTGITAAQETVASGAKVAGKSGAKTAAKSVSKKIMAKTFAKSSAMLGLKMIPAIGAVAGGIFALGRMFKGDWTGAAMEAGGIFLPSVSGLGVDALLVAKDMYHGIHGTQYEEDLLKDPELANSRMKELKEYAKEQMGIGQDAANSPPVDADKVDSEIIPLSKSEQDMSSPKSEQDMVSPVAPPVTTRVNGKDMTKDELLAAKKDGSVKRSIANTKLRELDMLEKKQQLGTSGATSGTFVEGNLVTPSAGAVDQKTSNAKDMSNREISKNSPEPLTNQQLTQNKQITNSVNNVSNQTVVQGSMRNQDSSYSEISHALAGVS
jgi:hypothetical protein|tara:strand:+ start:13580 stop:16003 length:2424 start_codon:yes stop_codon:yes gene_type:complete